MKNIKIALVSMFILAVISMTCMNQYNQLANALGVFIALMAGTVATYMVMILCYRSMTFFVSLLSSIGLCIYAAIMISMGVINSLIGAVDLPLYGIMLYLIIGIGCMTASMLVISNAYAKYTEQSQVRE